MVASIPLALTEMLRPEELGRLLEIAEIEQRKPEDVIVLALRSYLDRKAVKGAEEVAA